MNYIIEYRLAGNWEEWQVTNCLKEAQKIARSVAADRKCLVRIINIVLDNNSIV